MDICADETNAMFGTSISVDWRDDLKQILTGEEAQNNVIDSRTI